MKPVCDNTEVLVYLALASEVRNAECGIARPSSAASAPINACYVYASAPFHPSHSCVASQGPLHETPILVDRETEGPLVDAPHP